ncbi:MAG: hypothetical protein AAGK23_02020 [Pseudomonadota bacterium]
MSRYTYSDLADYDVQPGDVVSIRFSGVLRHYGVVTHRGTVIASSRLRGGVTETSLAAFADGKSIRRHRDRNGQHPFEIEARARRAMGSPYRLSESNCIDLTRHTHRRTPTPWQVGAATLRTLGDMVWGASKR